MNASNHRLERAIHANLIGDLLAQVLVLGTWVFLVHSRWVLALWMVRWIVVLGITLSQHLIRRQQRFHAVIVLAGGHALGALLTVAILPEFVPIIMLVMFGDLQLAKYLERRHLRPYLTSFVALAAGVAALSLQSWTGLADSAEQWVVISAIVSHAAVTGALTAQFGRESYVSLRVREQELQQLSQRLLIATDEERERVANALRRGALVDLGALADRLTTVRAALSGRRDEAVAVAEASVTEAQRSLGTLRTLSHGIFPDALRSYGLRTAITSLVADVPSVAQIDVPEARYDPSVELALYRCAALMADHAQSNAGTLSITATALPQTVRMVLTVRGGDASPVDPAQLQHVSDRIGAVGGELAMSGIGSDLTMAVEAAAAVNAPTQRVEAVEVAPTPDDRRSDHRILLSFNEAGATLAGAGLASATAVWLITRRPSAGAVATVLVVVLAAALWSLRKVRIGNFAAAITALCASTAVAGVLITAALPSFVPMTALLTVLPMVLALPYLAHRALNVIGFVQTAALAVVTLCGLRDQSLFDHSPLPSSITWIFVVLSTAAVAAVVAVTEVETHAELGERTAQVQRTLRRVVDASDSERQRIERDLHDGAQQHFVALSVQFRVLARLATTDTERANTLIDALLAEIDEASHDLAALVEGRFPEALSEGRLADAVHRIAAQSAMPVTVEITGANNVPVHLAAPAYFCCREAIQNASKHAGAGATLRVRVEATDHLLTFEVSDNGVGFDPYSRSAGGGLRSLRDRVEAVGGTFTVLSELGNGTTVTGQLPIGVAALVG